MPQGRKSVLAMTALRAWPVIPKILPACPFPRSANSRSRRAPAAHRTPAADAKDILARLRRVLLRPPRTLRLQARSVAAGVHLPAAYRNEAYYGAEDEPVGSRMFIGKLRSAETAPADEAATNLQPVRPFDRNRRFGRSQRRERIGDRGRAGIEAGVGTDERLLRSSAK